MASMFTPIWTFTVMSHIVHANFFLLSVKTKSKNRGILISFGNLPIVTLLRNAALPDIWASLS